MAYTSVPNGTNLDQLKARLSNEISILPGPKGVGKWSILNVLHDFVLGHEGTNDEHPRTIDSNVKYRKVHNGRNLSQCERALIVSTSNLWAGLLDPRFSTIDLELQSRMCGSGMWSRRYDGAHQDRQVAEFIEGSHV